MATYAPELKLNEPLLRKGALVLRAVNHPLRETILRLIHKKKQITVTEIYRTLRLKQSVTSQHLAILRKAGFVHAERQGKRVYYSIAYEKLASTQGLLQDLLRPK